MISKVVDRRLKAARISTPVTMAAAGRPSTMPTRRTVLALPESLRSTTSALDSHENPKAPANASWLYPAPQVACGFAAESANAGLSKTVTRYGWASPTNTSA